ncbi:unnamed protein product [Adineta ricciae]|uniref:G-protein coupled receptors family 1 profile domain-containing protein n=1 Tax=Adineta ricciae TaxID=249248 RepID=A0A814DJY9_ADIRI|nr:unnamed protein product [Adineta ricciae]CAF1155248.1 unnamed protein product [Adineta ricciae]
MSSLVSSLNLAQRLLVQYCHSTFFILGMVGSLINIVLYSTYRLRSNSCCIYFLVSSVCALILLPIGIVPQLYSLYNSPNPFTTISSFCKARMYLNQTSAMSCRWLLVMACLDRCSSCSTNAFIRRFSSLPVAKRAACLVLIICFIFPIHTLIYSNIQPPGGISCSITDDGVAVYHRFYTIIMGGVLPCLIVLLGSLVIWKRLQARKRRQIVISKDERMRRRNQIQEQQVMIMLIVQVGIFIISTIPFMSYNIYDTMTRTVTNKSADRKAIESFCKTLSELLVYLISMSFYSNTLVSRTFRKELIFLVKCMSSWGRYQRSTQVQPITATVTQNMAPRRLTKIQTGNTAK